MVLSYEALDRSSGERGISQSMLDIRQVWRKNVRKRCKSHRISKQNKICSMIRFCLSSKHQQHHRMSCNFHDMALSVPVIFGKLRLCNVLFKPTSSINLSENLEIEFIEH